MDIENTGFSPTTAESRISRCHLTDEDPFAGTSAADLFRISQKKFNVILKTKELVEVDIENKELIGIILKINYLTNDASHTYLRYGEKQRAQFLAAPLLKLEFCSTLSGYQVDRIQMHSLATISCLESAACEIDLLTGRRGKPLC